MIVDKFKFVKKGVTTIIEVVDSEARSLINNIQATIPTKTSQLQNDSGFTTFDGNYNSLTNKPTIPTKTSELTNDSGFTTFDGNYNSLTNKPTIPTKTSQLLNDSGFTTTEIINDCVKIQSKSSANVSVNANSIGTFEITPNAISGYKCIGCYMGFSGSYDFRAYNTYFSNGKGYIQVVNQGATQRGSANLNFIYIKEV